MTKGNWARNKARDRNFPKPRSNGTDGYVYVVFLGIENIYKIGHSGNFPDRLKSLTASNPRITARIVSRVDNMCHRKKALHKKFRKQRIDRECYSLEPSDLEFIQFYLDNHRPEAFYPLDVRLSP